MITNDRLVNLMKHLSEETALGHLKWDQMRDREFSPPDRGYRSFTTIFRKKHLLVRRGRRNNILAILDAGRPRVILWETHNPAPFTKELYDEVYKSCDKGSDKYISDLLGEWSTVLKISEERIPPPPPLK